MEQYADNIPLKSAGAPTPLRTDWRDQRDQHADYPPSPESQQEAVGLVPHPTPMVKKKGWFSGKIPWVVYIVSVAQMATFLGEIVNNGKPSIESRTVFENPTDAYQRF